MRKLLLFGGALARNCEKFSPESDSELCLCDAKSCDTFEPADVVDGFFDTYTTSRAGQRLHHEKFAKFPDSKLKFDEISFAGTLKQEVIGFGGALTDSALLAYKSLSQKARDQLENAWFGSSGANFNLVRVPIGGTDFSTFGYTLDDSSDDFSLKNFNLSAIDIEIRVPMLKRHKTRILASAWSAPKWMKNNKNLNGWTKLTGNPGDPIHKSWARHYVKYIEEMRRRGLGPDVWAVTTQNEPSMGLYVRSDWNANGFTPQHLRSWLELDFLPAIRSLPSPPMVFNLDDQRLFIPKTTDYLYASKLVRNQTDGVAVHWYWNQVVKSSVLDDFHKKYPEHLILSSEGCLGDFSFGPKRAFESVWYHAERYAVDIIDTLNHWTVGWIDWNLALDFTGGPNWAKNMRNACIHVNNDTVYKAPCHYIMMHFSRFIVPGTRIIDIAEKYKRKVVIGKLPTGNYAAVVLNNEPFSVEYKFRQNMSSFKITVQPHSVISLITDGN